MRAVAAGPAEGGVVEGEQRRIGQIDLVDIGVVGVDDIEVACAVQGHALLLIQVPSLQRGLRIAAVGLQGQFGDDFLAVVGHVDVSVAVHGDALRISPAAAQHALRVACSGERQLENRGISSIVTIVGDIDIPTGVDRYAPGIGE